MSKLRQWLEASVKWIVVGLAVLLSVALLGRKTKNIALEKEEKALDTEESVRKQNDAINDASLAFSKAKIDSLPKSVGALSDEAVKQELKNRGLE